MADGEYRRLSCGGCKTEFTQIGRGRSAKRCPDCRVPSHKPRSTREPKPPPSTTCKWCSLPIERPRRGKIYCSRRCAHRAKDGSTMTREQYRQQCRAGAAHYFWCEHCGREAYRQPGGSTKEHGYANRWCSMACRVARAKRVQAESEFLVRLARRARAANRPAPMPRDYVLGITYVPPVRTCPHCGAKWSAICRIGCSQFCQTPECQEERRRLARRRRGSGNTHIARAKRLGRKYGHWNVARVFERDKWTCQVCGVKTPKRLRGTTEPNAPELGHIVALADGGDHLIENCQCECRRCNAAKGVRARGQLWLAGFADTKG